MKNSIKIVQKQIQRIDFEVCKDALNPNVVLKEFLIYLYWNIVHCFISLSSERESVCKYGMTF